MPGRMAISSATVSATPRKVMKRVRYSWITPQWLPSSLLTSTSTASSLGRISVGSGPTRRSRASARLWAASVDITRVRLPRRAERIAVAAARLVLPAPPLPGGKAVHDVGHERHRLVAEPPVEVERLPDGLGGRPRHQDETRGGIAQERVHALRPLLEPIVHPLEGQEELGEVPQELQAQEAVDQTEGHGPGSGGDLEGQAAGHEVRPEEVPQDARVEEAHQAVRGVQEVEGVAGGPASGRDEGGAHR